MAPGRPRRNVLTRSVGFTDDERTAVEKERTRINLERLAALSAEIEAAGGSGEALRAKYTPATWAEALRSLAFGDNNRKATHAE